MVVIIGASSLKAATEVAPNDLKRVLSRISFASKGLSLNPNSIHKVLNIGSLLEKGKLRKARDIILWHNLLNNTIDKHRLNVQNTEKVPNLINTLRKHNWRFKAIIYCQRENAKHIFAELRTLNNSSITSRKEINFKSQTERVVVPTRPQENTSLNELGKKVFGNDSSAVHKS